MSEEAEDGDTYIIKKIKKGGGHHGGAWKVAYADFVTAMMAFFLLLWLLNVTTDEQKDAITNYFDPTHPKVSDSTSGAGGVLGGLSVATKGAQVSNVQPISPQKPTKTRPSLRGKPDSKPSPEKKNIEADPSKAKSEEELKKEAEEKKKAAEEQNRFDDAKSRIENKIQEIPQLAAMAENLIVDMTPEGLRIQIVDSEGKSMFAIGSAEMYQETQLLVGSVTEIIKELPNDISIRGHTDAAAYAEGATYTNWELSADRANATRRIIKQFGLPEERIDNVIGKADTDHYIDDNPLDARNRRISIILLKEEITKTLEELSQAAASSDTSDAASEETQDNDIVNKPQPLPAPLQPPPVGTFRKTPGQVEFP